MIIGLIGVRGSGKDYTANKLKEQYEADGKTVKIVGFSDGVRAVTFNKLGVKIETPEQYDEFKLNQVIHNGVSETGRYWLEYYGEGLRKQFPLYWSNYWFNEVKDLFDVDVIIASDCRFAHEVMSIQKMATYSGDDYQLLFCDYRSERYDDTNCETNAMALQVRSFATPDQEDITKIFEL